MKKRIISIVLSIVMLVSLLPTTALAADTHSHPVCGDEDCTSHGTDVTFLPLSSILGEADSSGRYEGATIEQAGKYYLDKNIHLYDGLIIAADVSLCLNGHILTYRGTYEGVTVQDGAALNICDCSVDESGMINTYEPQANTIAVRHGTVNLYSGTLKSDGSIALRGYVEGGNYTINQYGGTAWGDGSEVAVSVEGEEGASAAYNLYGGTVKTRSPNANVALQVMENAVLSISGAPEISQFSSWEYASDIYTETPIHIAGALTANAPKYSVRYAQRDDGLDGYIWTGIFTDGWDDHMDGKPHGDYFVSADPDLAVVKDTSGELKIAEAVAVSFDANGGKGTMDNVLVEKEGTYTLPSCTFTPPTGKQFAGWAQTAEGEVISETTITVSEDTTLYAVWEDAPAHSHDMSVECGGSGVTYTAWDGTTTPSGNVYLTDDVTLTDTLTISSGTVNLCLNGNSITKESGKVIQVNTGATLNICDCKGSGSIMATGDSGRGIYLNSVTGTVNVYGGTVQATGDSGNGIYINNGIGTVSGGTVKATGTNGKGIYINSECEVAVSGGTIEATGNNGRGIDNSSGANATVTGGNVTATGSESYGVYNGYAGSFKLSGAPAISGTAADVYIAGEKIVTITGALTYAEERAISVEMNTPGTFTSGWTEKMSDAAENYGSYFTSADGSYTVQPDGSGELKLAEPPAHSHSWSYSADGATITATCGGDSECDFSGNTTITIVKPTLTKYQGSGSENATIKDGKTSIGGIDTLPAIVYEKRDGTDLGTTPPTLPGDYKASITVGSATASVEYTIGKKSSSFYDNIDGDYTISDITHNSFKVTIVDVHGLRSLPLEYAVEDDIEGNNYTAATLDENYCFTVTVDDELIGEYIEFGLRVKAPDEYTEPGAMDTEMVQLLDVPVPTTYTVTVTNGTGNGDYAEGASVTITANAPETGKQFKEWTGVDGLTFTSGSATTATAIFTMPAEAVTVTATYEDIPVTAYTVTVTNDGNGTASASLTSGTTGTEVTLTATPNTGYHFKEWQVISGGVTVSENKFTIGTANVEIKAVFEEDAPGTYTVSGTVTGHDDFPVEGATVTLKRGNEVCGLTTTNASGQYSFSNVPAGVYNIVAEQGGVTMTILITVTNANITNGNITMPNGKVNSKLEVKDEGDVVTPDVVVDGLQEEAEAVKDANGAAIEVTVTMTVQAEAPDNSNPEHAAIKAVADSGATIDFLDISVIKEVFDGSNVGTSSISETHTVMEIVVPYDFTGKYHVTVYRQHGSETAKALTKLTDKPDSPADGFFWMDKTNGNIHIYAKKFSTYAIGYTTSDAGNSGGSNRPSGGGSYAHACVSKCQICGGCTDAKCTERVCAVKCKLLTMSFADVTEALWCYDAVTYVYHHGLMQGYGDNEFYPDGTVTRQQVWMILARMSGADPKSMTAARLWAMETGISDGTDPTAYVTRQQFVTMLWRYAKDMGWDVSMGEDTNILSYNDAFSVAEYAIPAMQWACGEGIIAGKTSANGMILAPKSNATRGQLATIMMRFCTKIAN